MVSLARTTENAEWWNKRLDIPMVLVSALVIPSILLEFGAASDTARAAGFVLNVVIWLAFVVEYAIGLKVAPDRKHFVRTHLLDAAIILFTVPLLPAELSSARLLRLVRLTRLLRLKPLVVWLVENSGERYVAGFAATVVLISGFTFSQFEDIPFGRGIYWAVTTVTTVGYGDVLPTRPESQVLAAVTMVIGIATFASLSAILAGRIIDAHNDSEDLAEQAATAELARELGQLRDDMRRLTHLVEAAQSAPRTSATDT